MKSCCIIGHRKLQDFIVLSVNDALETLINVHKVTTFKFGYYGEFNDYCYTILKAMKLRNPQIKLVLYAFCNEIAFTYEEAEEYERKHKNNKFKIFDEIVELKDIDESQFKTACVLRNKRLIDESDFCLLHYKSDYHLSKINGKQRNSGTRIAYEYACSKNKKIIII